MELTPKITLNWLLLGQTIFMILACAVNPEPFEWDTEIDPPPDGGADGDADGDMDGDADGDADSDTDTDADTDGDTDADADSDSDTDGLAEGELVWVKQIGGIKGDTGWDLLPFEDGSILMTGFFDEEAIFGAGEANETILVSQGGTDAFIAKYRPNGKLIFARQAGGVKGDAGRGVAALSDGGFVMVGEFFERAIFGEGEANETTLEAAGITDMYVARYAPDGTLIWATRGGGEMRDVAQRVDLLADGTILVVGDFTETAVFGAGEANETILTAAKYEDIFIARYGPDGKLIWVKRAGGKGHDYAHRVAVLDDGSVLITGQYEDTAVFGPGEAGETVLEDGLLWHMFIAKYRTDGTLVWARQAGGEWIDAGYGLASWSDGSFVVTGSFEFSAVFGKGEPNETVINSVNTTSRNHEIYLARYDPQGRLEWAVPAGGPGSDRGLSTKTLPDGGVLVSGAFSYQITFGLGEVNETTISTHHCSIYLAKFDRDGRFLWVKYAPGGS